MAALCCATRLIISSPVSNRSSGQLSDVERRRAVRSRQVFANGKRGLRAVCVRFGLCGRVLQREEAASSQERRRPGARLRVVRSIVPGRLLVGRQLQQVSVQTRATYLHARLVRSGELFERPAHGRLHLRPVRGVHRHAVRLFDAPLSGVRPVHAHQAGQNHRSAADYCLVLAEFDGQPSGADVRPAQLVRRPVQGAARVLRSDAVHSPAQIGRRPEPSVGQSDAAAETRRIRKAVPRHTLRSQR